MTENSRVRRQRVRALEFSPERILDALDIKAPSLSEPDAAERRQLRAILRHVAYLGCRGVLLEDHYIDRDFIEDYSLFYSRSLFPYPNHCKRLHFFTLSKTSIQRRLRSLRTRAARESRQEFHEACRSFSLDNYLGFSVIKPLSGCPVGRSVLRPYSPEADHGLLRDFSCTKTYVSHVGGLRLVVEGLAFQEQDVGVSACATTALWSALQKTEVTEGVPGATPAQITLSASRYALPFGRALPSEGLSVDQMCQATREFGVAPNLLRTDDRETARAYLYSLGISGMPAVLLIRSINNRQIRHAVALAGIKKTKVHSPCIVSLGIDDESGDLRAVYVHDDRYGAYFRADLDFDTTYPASQYPRFHLSIQQPPATEEWELTHILVPTHAKIRMSLGGLREIGIFLLNSINPYLEEAKHEIADEATLFSTFVLRGRRYQENLLRASSGNVRLVEKLSQTIPLSRFLSIIRLRGPRVGLIDFLVDSTSTERNPAILAAVVLERSDNSGAIANFLQDQLDLAMID